MLVIKVSSDVSKSTVSGGGEGRSSSSMDEDPLKLKVELRGHALEMFDIVFGEHIKLGLTLQFQNDSHATELAENSLISTTPSNLIFHVIYSFIEQLQIVVN